jgi:UDP-N-acetylmuramyl pentapeptide phosphotransferase/UDP-N-acetylglucosamine-1-phosphate transferase
MNYFVTALIFSFVTTLLLVRYHRLHAHVSSDDDFDGPQKFHSKTVSRVGGVSIALGLIGFYALAVFRQHPNIVQIGLLLLSSGLAFGVGFAEDVTKRVSPAVRLVVTALGAFLASMTISSVVYRVGFDALDPIFQIAAVSVIFTSFAVAGIANAINIIDGFNGLASMVVCGMLVSLFYVSFVVGDVFVLSFSLALLGALIGFLFWNYPSGSIFLGDGGAYLIGFLVAELAVFLTSRHASVSPWYPVLLFVYPLVETLFSMYRRRLKRQPASVPDGVHLHSLIYRRMIRWALGYQHLSAEQRNAMTAPYLWVLSSLAVIPATLFFQQTWVLIGFVFVFFASYLWIYSRLVYFKAPSWLGWLHLHRRNKQK